MKKILSVMLLAMTLLFVGGQNNFASAKDVYVGTSNTTGRDCYLMTETISTYRKSLHGINIKATLKMVRRSDGNIQYLYYDFHDAGSPAYFENSQGFEGHIDQYKTPIEWNMYWAMLDYL